MTITLYTHHSGGHMVPNPNLSAHGTVLDFLVALPIHGHTVNNYQSLCQVLNIMDFLPSVYNQNFI